MILPGGVILAGGRSRRMGTDKAGVLLAGRPLLDHVLDRLRPQVRALAVNAPDELADTVGPDCGPLAGILAGMDWVRAAFPDCPELVTAPVDTPFLPRDLVARLTAARAQAGVRIAYASSAGRTHPVVALWPVSLADDLRRALMEEGLRRVDAFIGRYPAVAVEFADGFENINRPEDILEAEKKFNHEGTKTRRKHED